MLIASSLWYSQNVNGIMWFVKNVCQKLTIDYELKIVGSRPQKQLIEMVKPIKEISIVENPDKVDEFFYKTDIVITPVFDGSGMKVKVADALSFGKPVVGSEHAFIGYNDMDFLANTKEEFIEIINRINLMNDEELINLQQKAYDKYRKDYSYECSSIKTKEIFK